MAKRRSPDNQPAKLPEYGELVSIMQSETATILSDYVRQYVGIVGGTPEPGQGIFINWDRVLTTQSYKELAWFDLYQEVERDPHVLAVMGSAKINIAGIPWDMSAYLKPGEKKPSLRNQAVADFVKNVLTDTGYFPQHIYNLMGALGKGFAVSEIVYDTVTGPGVRIKQILNRPQRRFQFDAVDRSLKLRDIKNPYYGTPLPDKKFVVHRVSAEWDNPFGDAIDQSLYWMWLFKKTVWKYWMMHLNVASSSIPLVQHPAKAPPEMKTEALDIAKMIRQGAYGRLPDNFKIIWAEAANGPQNAETYNNFIRTVNDEMSKAINGQTLTTEASSGTGTGTQALGNVHQGTQTARDVYRAHGFEATLNATVIPWITDFNFANVEGYPRFRFDLEDPEDLVREATIVKTLSDAGYDFDQEELSEKFNYTLTKKEPLKLNPANPIDKKLDKLNPDEPKEKDDEEEK